MDEENKKFTLAAKTFHEGDAISLDGTTGNIYEGIIPTVDATITGEFEKIMNWADKYRTMKVRTNADTPADAKKAVELGASAVVPVASRRCVVKLDAKKAEAKIRRWQAIAESAAKQSKRSYIPQVGPVMSLKEAFSYIEEQKFDLRMIPYELEKGMDGTKTVLEALAPGQQVAVFIGPEGGFDEEEIQLALKMGVKPVSLGKRILRTETAGPAILALLMMKLEGAF